MSDDYPHIETDDGELTVYSLGVVHISVCTDIEDRVKIAEAANRCCPTGIDGAWEISDDPTFAGGQPNPCPCDTYPETHQHFLLVC